MKIVNPNWQYARDFLKKEGIKVELIADYHDGEHGSLITMPDEDVIGCGPSELRDRYDDAEAYMIAKAFRLLSIFKRKGHLEIIDLVYKEKGKYIGVANG